MDFIKKLAVFMCLARKVPTNHSFCVLCPMSEDKADAIYLCASGKAVCTPECAERRGEVIAQVFVRKEGTWKYVA